MSVFVKLSNKEYLASSDTAITVTDKFGGMIATLESNAREMGVTADWGTLGIETDVVEYNRFLDQATLTLLTVSVNGYKEEA